MRPDSTLVKVLMSLYKDILCTLQKMNSHGSPCYDYGYPDPKIDYMKANMGRGGSNDGYYEIVQDGYLDFRKQRGL